mmetsp:Transcript_15799/g.34020  ORF Transcript_15799/g.34020 Transcript_15799/m.34020 type:complete len:422 (-) Transcript_15799:476-1741(-)
MVEAAAVAEYLPADSLMPWSDRYCAAEVRSPDAGSSFPLGAFAHSEPDPAASVAFAETDWAAVAAQIRSWQSLDDHYFGHCHLAAEAAVDHCSYPACFGTAVVVGAADQGDSFLPAFVNVEVLVVPFVVAAAAAAAVTAGKTDQSSYPPVDSGMVAAVVAHCAAVVMEWSDSAGSYSCFPFPLPAFGNFEADPFGTAADAAVVVAMAWMKSLQTPHFAADDAAAAVAVEVARTKNWQIPPLAFDSMIDAYSDSAAAAAVAVAVAAAAVRELDRNSPGTPAVAVEDVGKAPKAGATPRYPAVDAVDRSYRNRPEIPQEPRLPRAARRGEGRGHPQEDHRNPAGTHRHRHRHRHHHHRWLEVPNFRRHPIRCRSRERERWNRIRRTDRRHRETAAWEAVPPMVVVAVAASEIRSPSPFSGRIR